MRALGLVLLLASSEAEDCAGREKALAECARTVLGREPNPSSAWDQLAVASACGRIGGGVALPRTVGGAATIPRALPSSPIARPCASNAFAQVAKARRFAACPWCGGPLRGGRDAEIVHEKQWDCDGDESCAHWAVREKYCASCGRTVQERVYYGLHRYCTTGGAE